MEEMPPQSAEEADNEATLPKTSLESSVDAESSGQEHRLKPQASCPEQTQAKVWEKDWLTRAGQHNTAGLPLPLALSTLHRGGANLGVTARDYRGPWFLSYPGTPGPLIWRTSTARSCHEFRRLDVLGNPHK